jgi:putative FmdB family regulatory protein
MPIYTYRCENCGIQFDRRLHFDDKPLITCPECSKESLRKVYLPVGIVFKGSGFYTTDHRSSSGQGSAKKSEKKSEAKAETNSNEKKSSKED